MAVTVRPYTANPKPTDPTMMHIMPIVLSGSLRFSSPAYENNVLSILQQWWINKTIAAAAKRLQ